MPNDADEKISAEFRRRLMRLAPNQTVRAIVVLNLEEAQPERRGLQSRLQRSAAISDATNATKTSIRSLDRALGQLDARRISVSGVLGTVTIEGTAGAISCAGAFELRQGCDGRSTARKGRLTHRCIGGRVVLLLDLLFNENAVPNDDNRRIRLPGDLTCALCGPEERRGRGLHVRVR
jgi:hypothetical protein